jgi:N-acetylneuraminate synthase
MTVPLAAAAMGARVIEKHFTLDKSLPGNDHYLSMDAADLARWSASFEIMYQAQGNNEYRSVIEAEQTSRIMARRSLVSRVDIPEGSVITREMLTYKRPGTGISPADMDIVVGRQARVAIPEDQTLTWDMV